MRESALQSAVVSSARKKGMVARKLSFGEGWPDYMFLWQSQTLFIEFKAPGEKPTPLQVYVHDDLRKLGFQVEIVDDPIVGIQLVKGFYDRSNRLVAALRRSHDQDE